MGERFAHGHTLGRIPRQRSRYVPSTQFGRQNKHLEHVDDYSHGSLVRRWSAFGLTFLLAGCGWHPVYSSIGPGSPSVELSRITVAPVPERPGQLLRLALQDRLGRLAPSNSLNYELAISFAVRGETVAIRTDNTSTRVRLVATADWKLSGLDPLRTTLTSGFARDLDGLNLVNQQFFAADLNSEAVQRRMANAVADQIVLQLAAYFDVHSPRS